LVPVLVPIVGFWSQNRQ